MKKISWQDFLQMLAWCGAATRDVFYAEVLVLQVVFSWRYATQNNPDALHSARMKSAMSLTRATSCESACVTSQYERLSEISSGRIRTSVGSVRAIKHGNTPIPAPPPTAAA